MDHRALLALARSMGLPDDWLAGPDGRGGADGLRIAPVDADENGVERAIIVTWVEAGLPVGARLRLEPAARVGRVEWPQGSGGTPDYELYRGGAAERFDAWSDASGPRRQPFAAWAEARAREIMGAPRCALCGEPLARAAWGARCPGGAVHVCRGCLAGLGPEALHPRRWPFGERRCASCAVRCDDAALMAEGPGGKLCAACVGALPPAPKGPWWRRWRGG